MSQKIQKILAKKNHWRYKMRYVEYKDEKTKEDERAVNIADALAFMAELEAFNGTTEAKTTDNWYELKRQLRGLQLLEKEEAKK